MRYHQNGDGYAGKRWQASEVMRASGDIPSDVPIITNEPAAVLFWMERPAFEITEVWQTEPKAVYTRYGDEPDDPTQAVFREQGAALVVFDEIRWQLDHLYYENTPARVEALVRGLDVYGVYNDGGIYFYPGK